MPSAFIPSGLGYPAMLLAEQPVHQRSVHPGPLVLRAAPLKYPTPTPNGISHLEGGFTLRCLQRLSLPDLATRPCSWQNNRYTSGPSTPVLSYYGQLLSKILRPRRIGTELSHDVLNPARVPTALMGEPPNPWDLLQPQDAMSRHRGAKPLRRCELLGVISLLSPG